MTTSSTVTSSSIRIRVGFLNLILGAFNVLLVIAFIRFAAPHVDAILNLLASALTIVDVVLVGSKVFRSVKFTGFLLVTLLVFVYSLVSAAYAPIPTTIMATVNNPGANLYSGPGIAYPSYVSGYTGEELQVIGQFALDGKSWFKILSKNGDNLGPGETWIDSGAVTLKSGSVNEITPVTSIPVLPVLPPTPVPPVLITVNDKGAPGYFGPGRDYAVALTLPPRLRLRAIGYAANGGETWLTIQGANGEKFNDNEIWVNSAFVTFDGGSTINIPLVTAVPFPGVEIPTVPSPVDPASITASLEPFTNVRTGPSIDYPIASSLLGKPSFVVIAQTHIESYTWYLIETNGQQGWVREDRIHITPPDAHIPTTTNIPPLPQPPPVSQVCNPGEWNPVCGSNSCAADYVSQCNSAGTAYSCVWNPAQCSISGGPSWPPAPPRVSAPQPGVPTQPPFQCTQSWLNGQIQAYGASLHPPLNLQQTIQLLIGQGYDRNQNGSLDCDDYRAVTGQG